MSNLVIVAVPAQDERVWKVSSEKVPHLTLLYLGDINSLGDGDSSEANVQQIVDFVDHAVTVSEHGEFMLSVDHRGELGADKADVLFFKNDWSTKWITHFRNQLLQQNDIRSAWEKADQFGAKQDWVPHLTLGYPATPANSDDSEHGINWVSFDRIAVWTGDFTGPEFRLEWPDREDMAVAYGESAVADILQHHGVKGMRWGQRKTETVSVGGKTKMVTPKKAAKLDKNFEKKAGSADTFVKLHNAGADHVNAHISEMNSHFDKKYGTEKMNSGVLLNEHDPITKEYHKAYNDLFAAGLEKGAASLGTNATGTRRVKLYTNNHESIDDFVWSYGTEKIHHAATKIDLPPGDLSFTVTMDKQGRITKVTPLLSDGSMAQTSDLGAEFLAHHGVKGMKWGQRKAPPTAVAPHATSHVPHGEKKATQIHTQGGENHPAHEDAIKVAEARAKLQKSGLAALSNKELQDVQSRLNLERSVAQLESERRGSKGFVSKLLKKHGADSVSSISREAKKSFAKQVGGHAGREVGRHFIKRAFNTTVTEA